MLLRCARNWPIGSRSTQVGDNAFGQLAAMSQVPRLFIRRLVRKGALFGPVLNLLFQGKSSAEIAPDLSVTRREVELSVQYVEEFLAARYRSAGP